MYTFNGSGAQLMLHIIHTDDKYGFTSFCEVSKDGEIPFSSGPTDKCARRYCTDKLQVTQRSGGEVCLN